MEEKIIEILENVFTESIEFDREKAKDELLILFNISKQSELLEDFLIYMAINDRKPFENYGVLIDDYNKQKIL
jgi:hypothetical protein